MPDDAMPDDAMPDDAMPDDAMPDDAAEDPGLDEAFGGLFAPRRTGPRSGGEGAVGGAWTGGSPDDWDTGQLPAVTDPGGGGNWPGYAPEPGGGGDWPGYAPEPGSHRTSRNVIVALIAALALAVVAVAAGVLGFESHRRPGPSRSSAAQSSPPKSSPPKSSPPGGTRTGLVTLAPQVANNPDAGPIAKLLTAYFTDINSHDFSAYQELLNPQMQRSVTLAKFSAGYRSTTDSAATLTGISAPDAGHITANVTFTSHQDPADSPDQSACTTWGIRLFLERSGGGFLIGPAQRGYHASHQPCG
jgi:hypothetical protein